MVGVVFHQNSCAEVLTLRVWPDLEARPLQM